MVIVSSGETWASETIETWDLRGFRIFSKSVASIVVEVRDEVSRAWSADDLALVCLIIIIAFKTNKKKNGSRVINIMYIWNQSWIKGVRFFTK